GPTICGFAGSPIAQSPAEHEGTAVNVTLIDYGAGNVPSVERALRRLGAQVESTNLPEKIARAHCLVLPGVGHCAALIAALDAHSLRQPLIEAVGRGAVFLGICLGL